MEKRKILILLILSIFIIGMSLSGVSASTYKDYCHGSGQKHKLLGQKNTSVHLMWEPPIKMVKNIKSMSSYTS